MMKIHGVNLLILLVSVAWMAACSKSSIDVKSIGKGMHLDKAQESDIDFFFKNRMTNSRVYKTPGMKRWNILFEDESFVYFGFTSHEYLGNVDTSIGSVNKFYKVNRKELLKRFPAYKDIQGYHLYAIIAKNLDTQRDSLLYKKFCNGSGTEAEFELLDSNIMAYYVKYCEKFIFRKGKEIVRYEFVFDKNNLEILGKSRIETALH